MLRGLDALIHRGRELVESYAIEEEGWEPESPRPEYELRQFLTAGAAEIARVAGRDSQFLKHLPPSPDGTTKVTLNPVIPEATLGALAALRDAVAAGHLEELAARVRAAVQVDMLQQAEDLLLAGYHQAAMVLIAGVLENRLRQLCQDRGLQPAGRTLNAYNQALRDVYDQPTWRRIQALGDLRNEVAHGHFDAVRREQVLEELAFVRRFLEEHRA